MVAAHLCIHYVYVHTYIYIQHIIHTHTVNGLISAVKTTRFAFIYFRHSLAAIQGGDGMGGRGWLRKLSPCYNYNNHHCEHTYSLLYYAYIISLSLYIQCELSVFYTHNIHRVECFYTQVVQFNSIFHITFLNFLFSFLVIQ